jgi:NitT/TauT family transport system substrate-binding protein
VAAASIALVGCGGGASAPASAPASVAPVSAVPASAKPASAAAGSPASAKPAASSAAGASSAAKPSAGGAAASTSASAAAAGNLKHVKIGALPTIGNAPIYIAQQKGYFKDEGLEAEIVPFSSGAESIPPLAAGQVDAAASITPNAGLVNAVARGLPVRIVADDGTIHQNRNIANILIRKERQPNTGQYIDLATLKKPVKTASAAVDMVPDAIVKQSLAKAGFHDADVQYQYLGLPDINVGLKNGNIDLANSGEPLITIAVQQGLATRWKPMNDLYPNMPYSNLLFGPNLREKDKDAGQHFVRAFLRGVRDYEDAVGKNKNRADIVNIVGQPLKITPELFDAVEQQGGIAFFDPNGRVSIDALQPMVDFWAQTKALQVPSFDVKTLVDASFAQAAAQSLGSYS